MYNFKISQGTTQFFSPDPTSFLAFKRYHKFNTRTWGGATAKFNNGKIYLEGATAKFDTRETQKFRGFLEPRNLVPAKFSALIKLALRGHLNTNAKTRGIEHRTFDQGRHINYSFTNECCKKQTTPIDRLQVLTIAPVTVL